MNHSFHPAAEAEFLESVGYYESKVPGLGSAFIEEFEVVAGLIGESPKGWQVELPPDIRRAPFTDSRYPSSTEKSPAVSRFWLLHMTGGVRITGWAGFNRAICRYSLDATTGTGDIESTTRHAGLRSRR